METKANYVLVGIVTVVLFVAAFAFVYWTARPNQYADAVPLRILIPGSAAGLDRGARVMFNGVRVGQVERVFIDRNQPDMVIADARIDRLTPITKSTTADIVIAGLSFAANIDLKGGNAGEANLLEEAEKKGTLAQINANPSAVANLTETAQRLMTRADRVLTELEEVVEVVREPVTETVRNAETFTRALADNSGAIDEFLASVGELSTTLKGASGRLDTTLAAVEDLLKAVDDEKVANIVANADGFMQRLNDSSASLDTIMADISKGAAALSDFGTRASSTFDKVDQVMAGVNSEDVTAIVANFRQASDDLSAVANRVAGKGEDIEQIVSDARATMERLNAASARVDGLLTKVDGLLGSDQGEGLFAEARETFRSFRQVAETLNSRLGPITAGLAKFSTTGLRDVESFVRDGRRALGRIESAVSDFERNPQRIISGGAGEVRTIDGRRRR